MCNHKPGLSSCSVFSVLGRRTSRGKGCRFRRQQPTRLRRTFPASSRADRKFKSSWMDCSRPMGPPRCRMGLSSTLATQSREAKTKLSLADLPKEGGEYLLALDVQPDGTVSNKRNFAKFKIVTERPNGTPDVRFGGDGLAIDSQEPTENPFSSSPAARSTRSRCSQRVTRVGRNRLAAVSRLFKKCRRRRPDNNGVVDIHTCQDRIVDSQ